MAIHINQPDEPMVPPPYRRRDVEPHRAYILLAFAVISHLGLGVILGPVVIVLADRDLRKIGEGAMDPEGERWTWLARDVASAAVVLWVLPSLGFVIACTLYLVLLWN